MEEILTNPNFAYLLLAGSVLLTSLALVNPGTGILLHNSKSRKILLVKDRIGCNYTGLSLSKSIQGNFMTCLAKLYILERLWTSLRQCYQPRRLLQIFLYQKLFLHFRPFL